MFSGSGYTTRAPRRLPDVWISCKLKMATVNWKSFCAIFDSLQIHASGSFRSSLVLSPDPENMLSLEFRCYHVYKLRYAVCRIYFRVQAAIFDFSQIHTPGSLRSCLIAWLDPENMGIVVGISLLSCIEAEIYVRSFLLPVSGRHLRFSTYPDIGQYCHLSPRVARPQKHGYSL